MTSPEEASRTVSRTVSGTPSAVVVELPKLDRMSVRTIPDSSSTSGPFEPSPGYGPAVSSGTSVRLPVDADGADPDAEPGDAGAPDVEPDSLQAASRLA